MLCVVAAVAYGIMRAAAEWRAPLSPDVRVDLSAWRLPYYAGLSTLRMSIAYLLSLAFSIAYARVAAGSRTAERLMLPLLDILQSIPILSFMPGVVLGLAALFPGRTLGLEIAAIILIFTSQAWNLAFSFHQSLLTIPRELSEAAAVYRLGFWRRFTRLELPFGAISLIANSMMSWAGGWFFLMASEQFTLGSSNLRLPGLGSYLAAAADAGDTRALVLGLVDARARHRAARPAALAPTRRMVGSIQAGAVGFRCAAFAAARRAAGIHDAELGERARHATARACARSRALLRASPQHATRA